MGSEKLPRRTFVKQSTATLAAALATAHTGLEAWAHPGGNDTLRVGLVGCGDRGTGAAAQALKADPGTRLVAMGDVFEDQVQRSLRNLQGHSEGKVPYLENENAEDWAKQIDVPRDRQYAGFDAYRSVIDQVDVVILTAAPHFRPRHLKYAVDQGAHVFAEKPVATDAPGLRICLEACEEAQKKNLSLVSGLCWRYDNPRRAMMDQVHNSAVGDVVAIESVYNAGGVWEPRRTRDQVQSEMEYQLRNWYYYGWLSGDHIVEQAIHGLDTMAWAMGEQPPLRCWGTGGRQVRTEPQYGNIFDHFSVVYEYPNNVRGYHTCRHWPGADPRLNDSILGTKGFCNVFKNQILGENNWRYRGEKNNMYQTEHDKLFASIRGGKPVNNGPYMCHSTALALMGRMAAYTGQTVTWEMVLDSTDDLGPPIYQWGDLPTRPVPQPGTTKLV